MQQLSGGLWIENSKERRPVAVHVNARWSCVFAPCRLLGLSKDASFEEAQVARNFLYEVSRMQDEQEQGGRALPRLQIDTDPGALLTMHFPR